MLNALEPTCSRATCTESAHWMQDANVSRCTEAMRASSSAQMCWECLVEEEEFAILRDSANAIMDIAGLTAWLSAMAECSILAAGTDTVGATHLANAQRDGRAATARWCAPGASTTRAQGMGRALSAG